MRAGDDASANNISPRSFTLAGGGVGGRKECAGLARSGGF